MNSTSGNLTQYILNVEKLIYTWSNGCHPYNQLIPAVYGYVPSLAPGVVFVVLFFLSLVAHSTQALNFKQYWAIVFAIGALTELIGWIARLYSVYCPYNVNAFLAQLASLVLAPSFFTAGIYVILGRFINHFGRQTSLLSAKTYLYIFCCADALSLIIQAIGGGVASGAISQFPPSDPTTGTNIMVAGIVFQLASILVFSALFMDFLRRSRSLKWARRQRILVGATGLSVLLIIIRGIYRTIELSQGWNGYLINHEVYFVVLDGSLMILACGIFNFAHPGWVLGVRSTSIEKSSRHITCDAVIQN